MRPGFTLAADEDAGGLGIELEPLVLVGGPEVYRASGDASFEGGRVGSGKSPIKTSS